MNAKFFVATIFAIITLTVNAQTFQEMLNSIPSNATRIQAVDGTRIPEALRENNIQFKFSVTAAADERNCEFSYEDTLLTTPTAAKILDLAAARADDDEKVTRTKINGKDAVIIKDDDEVKTIIALAPDRILKTEVEKGKIEYSGKNLYTTYAPFLKNAFLFAIGKEKISLMKEGTHLVFLEAAGKDCLATVSIEFPSKAAADRAFKKAMRPEKDEPAENAIRAKIQQITIPGLAGERISCRVTITSSAELLALMEVVDELGDDVMDDDLIDD